MDKSTLHYWEKRKHAKLLALQDYAKQHLEKQLEELEHCDTHIENIKPLI